jgi:hypothetical protein
LATPHRLDLLAADSRNNINTVIPAKAGILSIPFRAGGPTIKVGDSRKTDPQESRHVATLPFR